MGGKTIIKKKAIDGCFSGESHFSASNKGLVGDILPLMLDYIDLVPLPVILSTGGDVPG